MIRSIAVFIAAALLVGTIGQAYGQSAGTQSKKGFIIGLGLGGGLTSVSTETRQFGQTASASETSAAFAGDFKLGAGLSERFMLYWMGRSALYHGTGSFGVATQTATIVGFGGLGASYWLSRKFGVNGGIGVSSLTTNRQTYFGLGLTAGGEYEFAAHWIVGLNLIFGKPQPETLEGVDRDTNSFAATLTLNYLHY